MLEGTQNNLIQCALSRRIERAKAQKMNLENEIQGLDYQLKNASQRTQQLQMK